MTGILSLLARMIATSRIRYARADLFELFPTGKVGALGRNVFAPAAVMADGGAGGGVDYEGRVAVWAGVGGSARGAK